MAELSFADRILGWHLGLGDIGDERTICHGYANCCVCEDCSERAKPRKFAPEPAKQPWEMAA